jgi:ATP synthase protein I
MTDRQTKNTGEALRSAGALSTVGLSFVLALLIGFWIGSTLDGWLHTGPLLTILFFFLGVAAGIVNVFRTVSRAFPTSTASPATGGPNTPPPGSPAAKTSDDDEPAGT